MAQVGTELRQPRLTLNFSSSHSPFPSVWVTRVHHRACLETRQRFDNCYLTTAKGNMRTICVHAGS